MGTPHPRSPPSGRSVRSQSRSPEIPVTDSTQIGRHGSDLLDTDDPWQDREVRISTNFADEIIDTARYFVQHALVTTIVLMRLLALPLMYIVQKLAWPQDRAWLAAISFPLPPDAACNDSTRPSGTERTLRQCLPYIANMITLPFRMTRDLYRICNLLQKHPEALERIGSRHSQRTEVFELHNFQRRNRRVLPGVSTHNLVGAPAPSEVYHAALSEHGDLDEVLAAFDCPSSQESVINDKDYPALQETNELDQLRSLQGTPPEMIRSMKQPDGTLPVKMARLHPDGFACFDSLSQIDRDNLAPPSTDKRAYTPKVWDRLARMDDQRRMSLPDECMGHDIKELLGNTENLERCPTHVRRHRRSLLPRRLGTRSALNLSSGASHVSQETAPITQGSTPRKGAKLKKRRPVPALANNSSMTSLQRRF